MYGDEVQALVFDIGGHSIRAGFAGDDEPRLFERTLIGSDWSSSDKLVGDNAVEKLIQDSSLNVSKVIERGNIIDWSNFETICEYPFKKYSLESRNHPILFTKHVLTNGHQKEKLTEVVFEKFQVPALFVEDQTILSLYASGRTTGMIVDIGDGLIQVQSVYEGHSINGSVIRSELGGSDVTRQLIQLLNQSGSYFNGNRDFELIDRLKIKHSEISKNCETSQTSTNDLSVSQWSHPTNLTYSSSIDSETNVKEKKTVQLDDGRSIELNGQQIECSECLFNPTKYGLYEKSIQQLVFESIRAVDIYGRRDMCSNIVASGSATMSKGFGDRLTSEMALKLPSKIKVVCAPERKISSWIGGSILASLSTFQSMWLSKEEFEEYGSSYVNHKCP